ncbi:MAG: S-layer homology domain-containing protein [Oscillospiraceae bacterium]|jgi:hypothetical protein|nr:S-layer homology domain-containing protein [Oscillospiraceae bacterium]
MKRFIAFGLTLALLFAFLPSLSTPVNALYSSFTDISGHWAEDVIDRWAANGVLVPETGTTTFRPSDNITRGELALIISRMMNYKTQTAEVLYDLAGVRADIAEAVRKCYYAGVMVGDNPGAQYNAMRPNDPITREGAILLIAKAMEVKPSEHPYAAFTDNSEIADWARPTILTMVDKGWITGSSTPGYFLPKRNISRASVITQIDNIIISGYFNTKGVQTTSYLGNAVVTADGVEIRDATITGDLIITEGVGDKGKVTLTNVTIGGTLWLNGGGSLIIAGQTSLKDIQQNKKSKSPVDISGSASTIIEKLSIPPGSSPMTLTGAYRNIEVNAPNYTLTLKNCTITNATFDGYEQTLTSDANSYISAVRINQPLKVKGNGKLGAVTMGAGASGSSFDIYPSSVTVPTDTTVFLGGSEYYNNTPNTATYKLPSDQIPPEMGDSQVTPGKISGDKIPLSWKAAGDNVTARAKLRYMLYYSESKFGMDTVAGIEQYGTPVMASFAANTLAATASRLKTNVAKYTFNVIVVDEAGNKACYTPVSIGLEGDEVPPLIREPAIRITDEKLNAKGELTSLTLSWERAQDDVTEPQNLKYTLLSSSDQSLVTLYDWIELESGVVKTGKVQMKATTDATEFKITAVKDFINQSTNFIVLVSDNAGNKSGYRILPYDRDEAAPLPSKDKEEAPAAIINPDGGANGTVTLTWGEADDSNGGKYSYYTPANELVYSIYWTLAKISKPEDIKTGVDGNATLLADSLRSTIYTDIIRDSKPNYVIVVSDKEGNRAVIATLTPAYPK